MASATVSVTNVTGLRVGDALSRSIGIWARVVIPYGLIYVLPLLPTLFNALEVHEHRAARQPYLTSSYWLLLLIAGGLDVVAKAIVCEASAHAADNRPTHVLAIIAAALSRLLPLLGAALCAAIAQMLGFVLLVVPGVILVCAYFVATPACVIERLGPIASLDRSSKLTKGNRWRIFGLFLIVAVFGGLAAAVPILGVRLAIGYPVAAVIQVILQLPLNVFTTVLTVVVFQDLRAAKEGAGGRRIAEVFD